MNRTAGDLWNSAGRGFILRSVKIVGCDGAAGNLGDSDHHVMAGALSVLCVTLYAPAMLTSDHSTELSVRQTVMSEVCL